MLHKSLYAVADRLLGATPDCNDPRNQFLAMMLHNISSEEYDNSVVAFFPSGAPDVKIYKASEIQTMIDNTAGTNCSFYIDFGAVDMNDKTTNQDIDVTVLPGTQPPPIITITYSLVLIKGILSLLNPTTFEFSKAVFNNMDTICFKTYLGTKDVLCWDSSGHQP